PTPLGDHITLERELDLPHEGAEGARLDDPDAVDVDGLEAPLMRIRGEVEVDALKALGELRRAGEPDMRDQDDELCAVFTERGGELVERIGAAIPQPLTKAGGLPSGDVRVGIADEADLHPADLAEDRGRQDALAARLNKDILGDGRIRELREERAHAGCAIGDLPVSWDGEIEAHVREEGHERLPLGKRGEFGALEGIASVDDEDRTLGGLCALVADGLSDSGKASSHCDAIARFIPKELGMLLDLSMEIGEEEEG